LTGCLRRRCTADDKAGLPGEEAAESVAGLGASAGFVGLVVTTVPIQPQALSAGAIDKNRWMKPGI